MQIASLAYISREKKIMGMDLKQSTVWFTFDFRLTSHKGGEDNVIVFLSDSSMTCFFARVSAT